MAKSSGSQSRSGIIGTQNLYWIILSAEREGSRSVLRRFQHYFSHITETAYIIHVFPGFHQYYTRALKWLAQRHYHKKKKKKTQRIQCDSNPGTLDYESNILPLRNAGLPSERERRWQLTLSQEREREREGREGEREKKEKDR